jgi:hypothetical protein
MKVLLGLHQKLELEETLEFQMRICGAHQLS